MRKIPLTPSKSILAVLGVFFVLGSTPVEFGEENTFFHGYVISNPVIRIGLGVNLTDIKIASSSGVKVYEVNSSYKLIAEDVDEVIIKGHKEKFSEMFLIRVAQSGDKRGAELIAQEMRSRIDQKVSVVRSSEDGVAANYLVVVGDFMTRGEALDYIKTLNAKGIQETWIIRKEITERESHPMWILVNDELRSLNDHTVLYFIPSHAHSYLSFNGRSYRGIFILKATPRGIVLTNLLNIDDYLKGVVPAELSPYSFRELEAHKAQAVAARTYAIKNMNKNEELGFDLCDTPNSQYYKGMNAEHPMSSQAVEQTRGEVAVYGGELIEALYTSTCGGMTENAEDIFGGPALPYLRSTECVYEKQKSWLVKSGGRLLPIYIRGRNISREIAALLSLDVIPQVTNPLFFRETAAYEEAEAWIQKAAFLFGKTAENYVPDPSPVNYLNFARLVVRIFDWRERIDNLMVSSEPGFILQGLSSIEEKDQSILAYFVKTGIFPAAEDLGNRDRILTRGEIVLSLWRILQRHGDVTQMVTFRGMNSPEVEVEIGETVQQFSLAPEAFLLKNFEGDYAFASQVVLLGGERMRMITNQDQIVFLEILYPPNTNILDRSSDYHSWQVRISREDLEKQIGEFYPIGQLIDIVTKKRGDSKRSIELLIKGTDSQALVRGFRIRRVLGLKETLFVIDREYDATGRITFFTFYGKGWGHGVGLCQVGAFAMARAGAGYKDILKKYYKGISISKIY